MDPDETDPGEFQISSDFLRFFDLIVLAAGIGGSGDDPRAATCALDRQGARGEFQKSEFNLSKLTLSTDTGVKNGFSDPTKVQ